MKKVCVLLCLVLITMCSTCLARYQVDLSRWVWYHATDTVSFYYDKETIDIIPRLPVRVWTLQYDRGRGVVNIMRELYDCSGSGRYCPMVLQVLDMETGKVLHQSEQKYIEWYAIVPGSPAEAFYREMKPKVDR